MKTLILAAGLLGLISGTSANAQVTDQYCASVQGTIRCEWATLEQCQAAFVGGGRGTCTPNPKYQKKDEKK